MKFDKKQKKIIRGSGGGDDPPQQHIPTEDADSLQSKAYLQLVDLISEGEIVGLVNGAQSIFINETPLQNSDGSYNFGGVTYDGRVGTQDQTYMSGFTTVENDIGVSVQVLNVQPIVRTITDSNVNRVRVRVMVPQLTMTDSGSGDIHGNSVDFSVWVQQSGGSYVKQISRTIRGKSSSSYELSVEVPLTGSSPWNIKVTRDTNDSINVNSQNKLYWQAYTEVIDAKLSYPNSALIGIKLDSQQFQAVPSRAYDVKLLKIRIPSNATVRADGSLTYSGSWDGTFQVAWSSDPAWVFYDLATNERYGLGAFIPQSQVDKWALYEISQYCNELVSDGNGGTEPRFSCNLMIADRGEAYSVMQSMASVFRGMIYWAAGSVTTTQDSPKDPSAIFTSSNVMDGKFTYNGASAKTMHTVALVSWNDPQDFYRTKVEYIEDQDAVARFGIQQTSIVAFGCTSQGQAHRLGKWLLYTEKNESETVTFKTGLDGLVARPGQIIQVQDPNRAGVRRGGRIHSATTGVVTVDADISESVSGYTLSAMLPSGEIAKSTVTSQSGRDLTVQPYFSEAPNSQSIWLLDSPEVETQYFRIIAIKEEDNQIYTVVAIAHDPQKFNAIENGLAFQARNYSILKEVTDAPKNVIISESLYQTTTEVKAKVTVSWDRVDRAVSYVVRYRKDNDNFIELPETQFNDQDILDSQPGVYTVQVSAVNALGKRSVVTQVSKEIYGKTAPPASVGGFSMIPNQGQAYLTWTRAPDLDVLVGGQVRIRHTPRTTSQSWFDAVDIVPAIPGTATSCVAPLLSGTYMAKFVDSSGNFSDDATMVVTTIPYGTALNVVHVETEDPSFAGTKTSMIIDTINGALVLADSTLFDDLPLIDSVGSIDFPGNIVSGGTYNFQNTIDLGGVWPSNIYSTIDLQAFDIGTVIDSRVDLIDDWQDIDGSSIDDVDAQLYVRTTEDDPAGTPAWTDWKLIRAGSYNARGFQFQLRCTSGSKDHNLFIKHLQVTIDMDDRAESFGPIASGTGTSYRVNYQFNFYATPAISITGESLNSGDYYQITSADKTGFNIVFKNSSGTTVSRTFYAIAKGYGRQVA